MIYKKGLCLLLGGVLLLSLGACGKNDDGSVRDVSDGDAVAETTENVLNVDTRAGELGEEIDCEDVIATFKKAYLSDYVFHENDEDLTLVFLEFEVQNNGEEELTTGMFSQTFTASTDGTNYKGLGIRSENFTYKQFGDVPTFNEPVQPGETRDGYVCLEVAADFETLTVSYFPRAGFMDWNLAYMYEINRADFEAAPEPVEAFS